MIKYPGSTVLTKIFQLIKSKFDSLAKVASTGSYNDLTDTPEVGIIYRASVIITSDNTSSVDIPISIKNVDSLSVYHNGLLLVPNVEYSATTTAITLNNYTANSGDTFTFISTSLTVTIINTTANNEL